MEPSWNFFTSKFSTTVLGLYAAAIINGLGLYSLSDESQYCVLSLFEMGNAFYYANRNISDTKDVQFEALTQMEDPDIDTTYFIDRQWYIWQNATVNLTESVSIHGASILGNCTSMATTAYQHLLYRYEILSSSITTLISMEDPTQALLTGVLSMAANSVQIKYHAEKMISAFTAEDYPTSIQQALSLALTIVTFDDVTFTEPSGVASVLPTAAVPVEASEAVEEISEDKNLKTGHHPIVKETLQEFLKRATQEDLQELLANATNITSLSLVDYVVSADYDYNPHSVVMGFSDRFSDFYGHRSHTQNCTRIIEQIEGRIVRMHENYQGKNSSIQAKLAVLAQKNDALQMEKYKIAVIEAELLEFIDQQGYLASEVARLTLNLTSVCLQGFYEETIKENLRPVFEKKGILYYFRLVLDNSLAIFDDLISFGELTAIAIMEGEAQVQWDNPIVQLILQGLFPNVNVADLKSQAARGSSSGQLELDEDLMKASFIEATQSHLKKQQVKIVESKIEAARPKEATSLSEMFPDESDSSFPSINSVDDSQVTRHQEGEEPLRQPKKSSTFASDAIDLLTVIKGLNYQMIGYQLGDMFGRLTVDTLNE